MMKLFISPLISSIVILAMVLNTGCLEDLYEDESQDYTEVELERVMKLTLETDGTVDYTVRLAAPEDQKYNNYWIQDVREFEITNSDSKAKFTGKEGLRYWEGTISGEGASVTIKAKYRIRMVEHTWDIDEKNSGKIDDIPSSYIKNYTGDRWEVNKFEDHYYNGDVDSDGQTPDYRIWPGQPLLNDLAHHIVGNEDNVFIMARKLYDFMKEGTTYNGTDYGPFTHPDVGEMNGDRIRFGGKPKSAYNTLTDGYGDCDDQAILFITLCRAVGIPAWMESGILFNQSSLDPDNAWEGHGWAKILVPMKNGDLEEPCVDPVKDLFFEKDPNRFSDWQDPGGERNDYWYEGIPKVPLDIESYYTSWTYSYMDLGISITTEDEYETISYSTSSGGDASELTTWGIVIIFIGIGIIAIFFAIVFFEIRRSRKQQERMGRNRSGYWWKMHDKKGPLRRDEVRDRAWEKDDHRDEIRDRAWKKDDHRERRSKRRRHSPSEHWTHRPRDTKWYDDEDYLRRRPSGSRSGRNLSKRRSRKDRYRKKYQSRDRDYRHDSYGIDESWDDDEWDRAAPGSKFRDDMEGRSSRRRDPPREPQEEVGWDDDEEYTDDYDDPDDDWNEDDGWH